MIMIKGDDKQDQYTSIRVRGNNKKEKESEKRYVIELSW